jgi:(p)ppGpp synthase/HD superfamily hydrolase
MDPSVTRAAARRIHAGQLTRAGEPLIDHVERVAAHVPAEGRALAFLHDALERGDGAVEELRELGCSDTDYGVLALLTREPTESYRAYVTRIARATGERGRIARRIKLADLEDHLRHHRARVPAPNYAWARRRIIAAQQERNEYVPAATIRRVA